MATPVIVNRVEGGKSIDRTPELISFDFILPAIKGTTEHFFVFSSPETLDLKGDVIREMLAGGDDEYARRSDLALTRNAC